jgi:hypothetical protein
MASLQCQDMPDAAVGPNDDRVGTPENLWRVRRERRRFCAGLACGDWRWVMRACGCGAWLMAS